MEGMSLSEEMMYSTVKIRFEDHDGYKGSGTGFFMLFGYNGETKEGHLVIVSNKHVLEYAKRIEIVITKAHLSGLPDDENHLKINLSLDHGEVVGHPDPDVDLCYFYTGNRQKDFGDYSQFYIFAFLNSYIPDVQIVKDLNAMEDITMIGYPIGIWDEKNNKPIFRNGKTATHPKFDYNGRKEFLIDVASFPGSSGSPVLILNDGLVKKKNGRLYAASRLLLLGVLSSGFLFDVEGNLVPEKIPTSSVKTISKIPSHLGIVIKAERILEMERDFVSRIKPPNP